MIIKKWFSIYKLNQEVSYLEALKHKLEIDCVKIEAKFEEKSKLFAEWDKIHDQNKNIIEALLKK